MKLEREWRLGDRIGGGGFGQVFEAVADDGTCGVVKLIPKAPGVERELLMVDGLQGVPNVVPVWEYGETFEAYALAMPRAQKSLRDVLEPGQRLPLADALRVLEDVLEALEALQDKVVHRDIKPENVLLLDGKWCLTDFGIARYAEATTAVDTQKYSMSPPYAAPEQWRGERATSATDVYAFGVMAYELLAGKWPFQGPDFRDQHLTADPPRLDRAPAALAGLVTECLFKASDARPTAANLLRRIRSIQQPSSAAIQKLQQANALAAEEAARTMTRAEAERLRRERREELFRAARDSFEALKSQLLQWTQEHLPRAGNKFPLRLGSAELRLEGPTRVQDGEFTHPSFEPGFNVIGYGRITVLTGNDRYRGRSHSLWFCDAQQSGLYRWFENAWMYNPLFGRSYLLQPIGLPPNQETFLALSPITGTTHQLAWPFTAVDQGDEADFIERWLGWFAEAALGQLSRPSRMPELDPSGSYRPFNIRR